MARDELSAHIQDSIAYLSITNSDFLKLSRSCVRPALFTSEAVSWLMKACYSFYDLTGKAPEDHICDAIEDATAALGESKRDLVYSFVERVSTMREPNAEYVISKLSSYVKSREFENGAVEFVRLVDRKQFLDAELLMYGVLKSGIESENVGCDYFEDHSGMYNRNAQEVLFTTGLKDFDDICKFHRKELVCLLGGPKGKKSWGCTWLGKAGLLCGLNVLHISHENSQEECEERYDRTIGAIAGWDYPDGIVDIRYIQDEKLEIDTQQRPCIADKSARANARNTMRKFGGRLFIKKYPMGSCDMREVERFLDYLEQFYGFVPDIMINDYPDIQKPLDSSKQTRDQLNESYIYNKKLADERNMLVLVVSQTTREKIRAKRLTMKDFAEDIRKLANVDKVVGICQTDAQAQSNLATLYIIAARVGKMDIGCGIVQNLDIGQFASQSFPMSFGVKVADEDEEYGSD